MVLVNPTAQTTVSLRLRWQLVGLQTASKAALGCAEKAEAELAILQTDVQTIYWKIWALLPKEPVVNAAEQERVHPTPSHPIPSHPTHPTLPSHPIPPIPSHPIPSHPIRSPHPTPPHQVQQPLLEHEAGVEQRAVAEQWAVADAVMDVDVVDGVQPLLEHEAGVAEQAAEQEAEQEEEEEEQEEQEVSPLEGGVQAREAPLGVAYFEFGEEEEEEEGVDDDDNDG